VPNDARAERRTGRTTHGPNNAGAEQRWCRTAALTVRGVRVFAVSALGGRGFWHSRFSALAVFGTRGFRHSRCSGRTLFSAA